MFLQLLHVKLPSALLLDAHNAASFLAAVPGARAAWRQEGIKMRRELCVCCRNYRRSPPPPWQRGSWRLVRGQDAHVSVRTAGENLGAAPPLWFQSQRHPWAFTLSAGSFLGGCGTSVPERIRLGSSFSPARWGPRFWLWVF